MTRVARPRAALAKAAGAGAALTWPAVASAHVGGGAFILLLPTHLYVAGGAIVVAASFALIAAVPPRLVARLEAFSLEWRVGRVPWRPALSTGSSLVSLAATVLLVAAGLLGSRDPLANPLPLFVWTVWWIGFTYLHAVVGNLWAHLNPWTGLYRLTTSAGPLRGWRERPPLVYPPWVGHWPAVAGFLAFAWFELVYPAPADPAVLASVVAGYVLAHFAGVLAFGETWLNEAEPFSVFFRMVSWLAPVGARTADRPRPGAGTGPELELTLPALRLLRQTAPPTSLAAFVLLVLSSVSFDGLSRTFAWLGLLGENPLVHPGRTALMAPNTLGLLGLFLALMLAYVAAVRPVPSSPASVFRGTGWSPCSRSRSSRSPAGTTSPTTCRCSWWTSSTRSGPPPTRSPGAGISWGPAISPWSPRSSRIRRGSTRSGIARSRSSWPRTWGASSSPTRSRCASPARHGRR